MTIAIVKHLEADMATAHKAGNDHAFTVARNRRQAIWNYRDGSIDLAKTQYILGKTQAARTDEDGNVFVAADTVCRTCAAWKGDITDE